MGSVSDVLNWARDQIGHVGGADYWQIVYGYRSNADWCAVFDSAVYKVTDTPCAYWPDPCAFDLDNKAGIGRAWVEPYDLKPGDSIAYTWTNNPYDGDHVGIVEAVEGWGCYTTIEGNCTNEVKRRYRTVWDDGIIGGIRPNWEGDIELYVFEDVYEGAQGDTVAMCQAALNVRNDAGLYVDGWCGPVTADAIEAYQRAAGLYVDGWCGPKTWAKLLTKN